MGTRPALKNVMQRIDLLDATKCRGVLGNQRQQLVEQHLERARLAREDTLCRESMSPPERNWLGTTRSALARHWNLLTGLTAEQPSYA